MAIWTPAAFIGDIRGRVGDQVFSFQKGTHYIKQHNPNPADPLTAAQQLVRNSWANLSPVWRTLTDQQRDLWTKYGGLQQRPLGGFNAFMSANVALYTSGIPSPTRRDHPPLTPATPTAVAGFSAYVLHATANILLWSAPSSPALYVQSWKRYDWNYYGGYNPGWVIVAATISTAGGYVHTHDTPSGERTWYRARSIDLWGRKSPFTHTIKVTTP